MNKSQQAFFDFIEKGEKVAFLFAPSFVVNFDYPDVIAMSRALGVDLVTEITYGSYLVNQHYNHYIKDHPDQKYFINTTCPTIVQLVKTKFPDLEKYLFPHISCVMAFINFANTLYPKHKLVFISPCAAKRVIELPLMYEWSLVLTYRDLQEIFDMKGIKAEDFKNVEDDWDSFSRVDTKLYPVEGGLALTARWDEYFPHLKVVAMSGLNKVIPLLQEMRKGELPAGIFDISSCEGSCIGGPMNLRQDLSISERKDKVISYYKKFHEKKDFDRKK